MDGRRANQGRMPCGAKSEARPARARARAAARLAKPGFPRDSQKARGSRRSCRLPDAQVPGHLAPERAASRPLRRLRSEEHTSELQSLMRISYAVFCLKKKNIHHHYQF